MKPKFKEGDIVFLPKERRRDLGPLNSYLSEMAGQEVRITSVPNGTIFPYEVETLSGDWIDCVYESEMSDEAVSESDAVKVLTEEELGRLDWLNREIEFMREALDAYEEERDYIMWKRGESGL